MRLPISTSLSDARRKAAFEVCGNIRYGHKSEEFRRHLTRADVYYHPTQSQSCGWLMINGLMIIDRNTYWARERWCWKPSRFGVLSERVDFSKANRIDSSVTRRCAWELLRYERERNGLVPAGCAWHRKLSIHWYITLVIELEAISAPFKWDIFTSGSDHCKAKRREL